MEISTTTSLHPWFVSGLVAGEGRFSVSFTLHKRLNVGIETRPSFSISLNRRDLALIQQVQAFFQCGAIRYSKSDRTYKYEVRSVHDLVAKVLPHFQQYPLQGTKSEDFQKFSEICQGIRANHHLSKKYLPELIEKAYTMNPSGKRKHEKGDLLRVLDE
jgi:hypothetical protein